MRWQRGRRSRNIEDRRGQRVRRAAPVTGGIGVVAIVIVASLMGIDPRIILNSGLVGPQGGGSSAGSPVSDSAPPSAAEQELADFTSVVLADTEDTWHGLFRAAGETYPVPKLVLFSGATRSDCGMGEAAMGPFYCPADQKVYIDLSFYNDLKKRHRAPGDFAQAYVIAHEVGHHVQNVTGIAREVRSRQQRVSKVEGNQLQVRMELQADCFAGVWAHHADRARNILESGDIEEALRAASAIGDDRLQKQARGYVTPESFTHGTSEQRVRWFRRGIEHGSIGGCDTFSATRI